MRYKPSTKWKVASLSERQREHFDIARSFERHFSVSDYRDRYLERFPARPRTSVLPSDHAYNNNQAAKGDFPLFLERTGRGEYRFVGLVDPLT